MDNPYAPPESGDGDPRMPDDELDALRPTWVIRVAWMALVGAGFLAIVSGGQLLIGGYSYGLIRQAAPFSMIGIGVVALLDGAKLMRMRRWAAIGGVIVSGLMILLVVAWIVFAGSSGGVISFIHLIVPGVAGGSMVFSIMALKPCALAEEARRRLAETGIDARF